MQIRFDSLAQQVEHNTFNVGVLGSSPKRITSKKRVTSGDSLFLFFNFLLYLHSEANGENNGAVFLYGLKFLYICLPLREKTI